MCFSINSVTSVYDNNCTSYDCLILYLGCPSVIRCDYGTENVSIASIQIAFRFYHTDSRAREKSFIYGPSKANIVS